MPLTRCLSAFPAPSRLHPFDAALLHLTLNTQAYRCVGVWCVGRQARTRHPPPRAPTHPSTSPLCLLPALSFPRWTPCGKLCRKLAKGTQLELRVRPTNRWGQG